VQHILHECWVDERPCEVVERFAHALENGDLLALAAEDLPCNRCRGAERTIAGLTGLRLGKHERRTLLSAPGPQAWPPQIIVLRGASRTTGEGIRRAARRLHRAGLLTLFWRPEEYPPFDRKRAVRLTPLGQALVERLHGRIAAGETIRWTATLRNALLKAVRQEPAELLAGFRAIVEKRRGATQLGANLAAKLGNAQGAKRALEKASSLDALLRATDQATKT
jgi:hypothetical protein